MKKIILFLSLLISLDAICQNDPVYQVVEQQPEFQGGHLTMYNYLKTNLIYPQAALKRQIQGKVFMSFIVEKNGQLSDITILKGLGYGCDEEAVRLLETMPLWKAGKQGGKVVRVKYNLPIEFSLGGNRFEDEDDSVYEAVDRPSKFLGQFENYILENMIYPQQAIQRGIQGIIDVGFIVKKNGILSNFQLLSGLGYGCNEEALRLAKAMQHWVAGELNGRKVRTKNYVSIAFSIQNYKLYSKEYSRFRRY